MADRKHPDDHEPEATTPAPRAARGTEKTSQQASASRPAVRATARPTAGEEAGYDIITQILRGVALTAFLTASILAILVTQLIGAPFYFFNRQIFYDYMAMSKRYFTIVAMVMTQTFGSTTIRISGDESVAGQIELADDGFVKFKFPERLVLIANHQIYTDWLYLWWVGYANVPDMHGYLYIILKESLQWIPLVGTGMMFFGFIFMARKMATDRPRLAYRLNKLKAGRIDGRGRVYWDPMWLLLFPEGTSLSLNGRNKSALWAEKNGWKDPEHMMLPRSTGTYFCLTELRGTVDYVYDCTVAYEGIARGEFGEDVFRISSMYLKGKSPKSVNFYWRRFKLDDIPLDSQTEFDAWLREQWYKKDEFMEQYMTTGRFPPLVGSPVDFITVEPRVRSLREMLQVFRLISISTLSLFILRKLFPAIFDPAYLVKNWTLWR